MRAIRHVLLAAAVVLVAAGCEPKPATLVATTAPPVAEVTSSAPELTAEQVQYLATLAWQHAETVAFLDAVAAARAGVPDQLRRIGWCEAGSYLSLPRWSTNYQALTHGHDGASGGYQMVGSTYLAWARAIGVDTARWPRAYLAPDWVQDQVATYGYAGGAGKGHWTASSSCWR